MRVLSAVCVVTSAVVANGFPATSSYQRARVGAAPWRSVPKPLAPEAATPTTPLTMMAAAKSRTGISRRLFGDAAGDENAALKRIIKKQIKKQFIGRQLPDGVVDIALDAAVAAVDGTPGGKRALSLTRGGISDQDKAKITTAVCEGRPTSPDIAVVPDRPRPVATTTSSPKPS